MREGTREGVCEWGGGGVCESTLIRVTRHRRMNHESLHRRSRRMKRPSGTEGVRRIAQSCPELWVVEVLPHQGSVAGRYRGGHGGARFAGDRAGLVVVGLTLSIGGQ